MDGCPICEATGVRCATDTDEPCFLCQHCGATWRYELGHVLVTF
jgi:transposase-like protein